MNEYEFKVTTHGRALLAACMATGKGLDVTGVDVGSGAVPEDIDLADVHALFAPVASGEAADRRHEDNRFYLTVQYANSLHPEIGTFYLSEFIVYARHPETGENTDLLYATLGNYMQPVPAYSANFPPSTFSFPLVIIVSDEIEVSVTAAPGLVTFDDLNGVTARMLTAHNDDMAAHPDLREVVSEAEIQAMVDGTYVPGEDSGGGDTDEMATEDDIQNIVDNLFKE